MHRLHLPVATLVSAVLYGLAFPPAALRGLAWVALVPFFVSVRRAGWAGAAGLAWLWTVAAADPVGDWFPRSVSTYYQQPLAIGVGFFAGVSSIMAAPYFVAFAACYRACARRGGASLPLLAAAAWVAGEVARTTLLTGNPWALFGYSQARVAPVVQIADVTGIYGVSFVLVAVNAALAEAWQALRMRPRPLRRALAGLAGAGLAAGTVLGYGGWRLQQARSAGAGPPGITVGIVQGNLDLGSQWRQDFYGRNLEAYMRLTHAVLEAERPRVVFWPESAMTFFLDEEPLYRAAIARVLAAAGAQLVAGAPRFVGSEHRPIYYNTAFLLAPDGTILGWYDKQRLLPFAEYFPLGSSELLRRRFARVREFAPGVSSALLPTPAGRAGIVICNEAVFPDIAAARVRAGADYLVNLANDTWVSDPKFSEQLFDIVSIRAVEQRRYLVRASTSGFSAIVDPWGRAQAMTPPFTQAWLAGTVRGADTVTAYCRVGDAFALACVAAAGAGALARAAQRPGRTGTGARPDSPSPSPAASASASTSTSTPARA
jgi:apolipoprotein N-acyltransferase